MAEIVSHSSEYQEGGKVDMKKSGRQVNFSFLRQKRR